ncbi:hypothetical protein [Jidongwangia harbinensis]|uniref:hypothetical protein n=1 Tax=Jidongwangia harbinensis TaxID=2878561 RepID=UPI001CD92DB4|nr:hypothetical protein [Jidongwangia harbinensis]MCA2219115.1 hypothetical protein [Jidongwangia harbinensis]
MSLLHQQRVRVFRNSQSFFAPERPWEAFCPSCEMTAHAICMDVFATWHEAVAWANSHLRQYHCRFCIDQQMPAGRSDVLGELYERCPACGPACEHCDGLAVYPANYNTPAELAVDLRVLKLTAVFCDGCHGVVAVIPLDPEVYA